MTKKSAVKKTELLPVESAAENALEAIKDVFAEPKTLEKLLNSGKMQNVFTQLGKWAELDHASETQAPIAGEVLAKILALPLDTQKPLVWGMADAFGLPRPSYERSGAGRPTTGRNELAAVLYGRYPDMLMKDKGKDTRGAKRITDHVRRFLIRTGERQSRKSEQNEARDTNAPTRAFKVVFKALWEVAQTEIEQKVLVGLFMKKGIDPESMNKWVEKKMWSKFASTFFNVMEVEAKTIDGHDSPDISA